MSRLVIAKYEELVRDGTVTRGFSIDDLVRCKLYLRADYVKSLHRKETIGYSVLNKKLLYGFFFVLQDCNR